MNTAETLKTLCALNAVTGFEQQAAQTVAELLRPYCSEIEIDPFGTVTAVRRCGRENAKSVLLDAHLDQVGLIVTEVLDGGFVRFAQVGGIDSRMMLGCEVTLLTKPEPIYGVVACMPPHILKPSDREKAVPLNDMMIDTGLLDAKARVPVGTPIVYRQEATALLGDVLMSRSLDDRAGVAAILYALDRLKDCPLDVDLMVMVSAQEEVTELGSMTGTFRMRPDYAIAIDVSHAKTPDAPDGETFKFGGGVMIGMGPNMNTRFTKYLRKIALSEGMEHQFEVMEGNTGTNAWLMQIAAYGTAQAILSIPLRYMHTPIEVIRICDVESVGDLVYHFLRTFDGEVRL